MRDSRFIRDLYLSGKKVLIWNDLATCHQSILQPH